MRYLIEIVLTVLVMATSLGAQRQGDLCVMAGTIQPGVCRQIMRCSAVLEAAFRGIPYQVCASPENRLIVCCPWVPGQEIGLQARCQANTTTPREGDNCTMVDTGKAGVCSQFSTCHTAIEAASKGQSPQICAVEGTTPIICCPLVTVAEGDQCLVAETGRAGKCLLISKCPVAVKAALKGKSPQICALDGSVPVVCCEGVVEGDNCTAINTGKAGVCRPFANCHTAKEAANKGILPQTCDVEGTVQTVCCPLSTIVEGDVCTVVDTGKVGVCRLFANCQTAKEAASKGIFPQICTLDGSAPVVCCEGIVEGDNCTVVETGRAGVCRPFANCQTAKEAANIGILPQICDVKGTKQNVCCPPEIIVEGSNCTLKHTGKVGVCRPFANCHSAQEGASKGIFPQKCDLTDNESELVCCTKTDCPPLLKGLVTQLPIGSKAADYCIELAEKIHPCQETRSGWTRGDLCPLLTPDSNILYHRTPMTTTAEAPYYGRIGTGQRGDITWRVYSVSLVSEEWVLCSAYAIHVIGFSNVKFVGLGGTFTPRYNPDEIYGISTKHIHPLYNHSYSYSYNSIALLQLDRRVTFTARILPVCLHTGTPLPDSGFIQTGWDGVSTSPHHKTTMQRLSQEECSRAFPTGGWHPAGVKHDQEICSRPVNTTGGCPGWYAGSPLTLHNSHRVVCTHLLVGLKNYYISSSCTVTNTRISSFTPWIEGIVWP